MPARILQLRKRTTGRRILQACHTLVVRPLRPPQVAQYESNGASGTLHPGCPVTLSSDYKRHGDAREGPLNPGKVGVVVEHRIVDTVSRVKVSSCGTVYGVLYAEYLQLPEGKKACLAEGGLGPTL